MKNNKSIQAQVMGLAVALLMVAGAVGFIGAVGSIVVAKFYQEIPDDNLPNIQAVNNIISSARVGRMFAMAMALEGTTHDEIADFTKRINDAKSKYDVAIQEYLAVPYNDAEEKQIFEAYQRGTGEMWQLIEKLSTLAKSNPGAGTPEAQQMTQIALREMVQLADKNNSLGSDLSNYHEKFVQTNVNRAQTAAGLSILISLLIIGAASLIGYRSAKGFATRLAESLLAISGALNEAGNQVSSAATEISASSQQLSSSTAEQAASLAETAASIEEMNSMVNKNSENSKAAAEVSQDAEQTANRGQQGVSNMILSMEEIASSNQQVNDILKVIHEIGEKTKVINDIVFQTKLLSFNASVEAARAGEHGKGFAVVAEEVGNLAQMSGNAAKEISSLLDASLQKVETIVQNTHQKVEAGTQTARESGTILNEIVSGIARVALMAGEISSASSEQASGVSEITKAMNQLDQATQQNAATSQEAASAAEQLSAQAESLNNLVGDLVQLVNGKPGGAAPAPVASAPVVKTPKAKVSLKNKENKKVIPITRNKNRAPQMESAGTSMPVDAPSFEDARFKDV